MSATVFNAKVIVTEQMERLMCVAAQEVTYRAITACALEYNFNAEEALRFLRLDTIKVSRSKTEKAVKPKVVSAKSSFALPYNGECNDALCHGLRQNNGLYTQCQTVRKGDNMFCKSCQSSADKNDGVPEYGTIEQRQSVGIFEYVDPKGRKPTAYVKIMKKYKLTQEQVIEEAGKLNITIDANHYVEEAKETKRGRPKAEKVPKEPKGAKGRPKKTKKVLEIEGEEEDLFASLVASANSAEEEEEVEEEVVVKPVKKGKSDEERIQKEQEKAEKEAKLAAEKAEKAAKLAAEKEAKEAKLAAEKAEKEAKLAAEKEAKALKKQQEEEAKALKKQQEEEAKAAKEAQRLKEKEEKEAAKAAKTKKPVVATPEVVEEEEQQPDVVKKIEIDGKKYLKSKNTGIIYDYKEYIQNGEQVVVGKWNETKNKIDFTVVDEESEEEYDE